ncbi:MAG: NADH-quinone oxidoreductase subunit [Humisphaera sp.]|nr:NADH-quinone oxidoreductase subunit [Humisphaera sp.]
MPTPALLLLIATLLPLLGFVILLFVGKKMGTPLAGWVGTAMIGGSFVCSLLAMISWYTVPDGSAWGFEQGPINLPYHWIPTGDGIQQHKPGFLDIGIFVDSLTIAMFAMITLVATLVHVFSIGYMREDPRYPRFFTYLGLFCFSMLGLVIGGTILQLFIFWELVGLCSYLLIGFWYEKKSASNAAIKAFVVNRVGDFGFLIGFGILFYHLGNVSLPSLWGLLGNAGTLNEGQLPIPGGYITATLLTVIGIGLFFGAVGKSAQFPLHVWLPDAMEGPTPVSALIHAATMVAAGVYLVGRIFPILTPNAKLFIAIIGCITLTMAALIAIAQTDIKKVLAYSTLSQLGYMILAMGIGSWVGGLFHLITHAFFKALLFLGSGSVINAAHHEQELPQYGGLIRKIPVTGITFDIAVLAIAGTPGFSGYYSKDLILANAGSISTLAEQAGRSNWYWALFAFPAAIAFITPFYMTRCWMLTFWGKPRNQHVYDHAREHPVMYAPLIVLAILSVVGGYALNIRELLVASTIETKKYVEAQHPGVTFRGYETAWPPYDPTVKPKTPEVLEGGAAPPKVETPAAATHHAPDAAGWHLVHTIVFWAFIVGIGVGVIVYWNGYWLAAPLTARGPLAPIRIWLYRRMYFDELYSLVFVSVVMGLSRLSAAFDKYVVDGLVNLAGWTVRRASTLAGLHDKYVVDGAVNGMAELTQNVGAAVRAPQSGRIRMYVTILMAAVALGLAGAIIVALS